MDKFPYALVLAPYPIRLSIGTLRKPTLKEIYDLDFNLYTSYEALAKLTPKDYYTKMDGDEGKEIWRSFTDKQKKEIELFNIVKSNESLCNDYTDLFNFFFEETVIFIEGFFVWLNKPINIYELQEKNEQIPEDAISGIVGDEKMFQDVLEAIQQVCCIYEKKVDADGKEVKFKNDIAKEIFEKIQKAENERNEKAEQERSKEFTIPNIISAVSNRHPTISPINVWELTVFQLIDAFQRLQAAANYEISATNVSVWGDKDNHFDINAWFLNKYDT